MMTPRIGITITAMAGLVLSQSAGASPNCMVGTTTNLLVMSILPAPPGRPWLQSTSASTRIILERCSYSPQKKDGFCFFAANVPAGRYYFQEVLPNARNNLTYPVSTPTLWFEVSPVGLTYIGDWQVEFGDQRVIQRLEIRENLAHFDRMQALCGWPSQRLFLGRPKTPLVEVVN